MGVENGMFRSEIGSGFEDPGGTPPPRIWRSTPPGGRYTVTHSITLNLLMAQCTYVLATVFPTACYKIVISQCSNLTFSSGIPLDR